jgi:hypothetical protein
MRRKAWRSTDPVLRRAVKRKRPLAAFGRDDGVTIREATVNAGLDSQALDRKGWVSRISLRGGRSGGGGRTYDVGRLKPDELPLGLTSNEGSSEGEAREDEGGGGGDGEHDRGGEEWACDEDAEGRGCDDRGPASYTPRRGEGCEEEGRLPVTFAVTATFLSGLVRRSSSVCYGAYTRLLRQLKARGAARCSVRAGRACKGRAGPVRWAAARDPSTG